MLKKIFSITSDVTPPTGRTFCKFIFLFQGRTGSTYITDRLNSHPQVKMEPEVWGGWGFQIPEKEKPEHAARQNKWMSDFYSDKYINDFRAIGFKTKLDDIINKRSFIEHLKSNGIKIIHSSRRNIVKLVVSEINAQRLFNDTGKWNLDNKSERPKPFMLDLDEFDLKMKWREQIEQWLDGYIQMIHNPTLNLCYEDMLYNEDDFFNRIYDFIRVDHIKTTSNTIKNTPNDLRDIILNYDELFKKYEYTRYESMILEV